MTKVTIKPDAPSLVPAAEPVTVVDSSGRTITLKKPGVLAQFRLVEIMGDSARNETLMSMTMPMIYVAEIDGAKVPSFTKRLEIDGLIQRLDEHGIAAVMQGVVDNFAQPSPEAAVGNSAE